MTVLANEQVVDGHCERCGSEVEQRELEQWFFKTTAYAERLLTDLDPLNWPENVKDLQRNWIGKSEGAEIDFYLDFKKNPSDNDRVGPDGKKAHIPVFTTRPDTLYGATYMVLSPEHLWVTLAIREDHDVVENKDEVIAYVNEAKKKSEIERLAEGREKTGVEVKGVKAINPATGEEVPIFVADYVLAQYGTGAIMAVPAHDERDCEFAKKFELPIRYVIAPHLIDEKNPPRPDKKTVERTMVHAMIRDAKTGKFLILDWKKHPWKTFVLGGVDEGEDIVEAARREVLEETGYTKLTFKKIVGGPGCTEYFAAHKDENRFATAYAVLFELEDDSKVEVSAEEQAKHEPMWMDLDEFERDPELTCSELPYWRNAIEEDVPYIGGGMLVNSAEFDGMRNDEAKEKITESVGGKMVTTYKLRDWLLSRQRYWGCPIPIVYDPDGNPHPVPDEHLPWLLPEDVTDFAPKGTSPIGTSKELVERTEKIFGKGWKPEIDTMDTFVDSSWYFLRYLDPKNDQQFSSLERQKLWMPINRYSGGAEHTTMHVLYSRFFQKALFDLGLATVEEPYLERFNRGIILAEDGRKMSKRWGNVVDPDEQVLNVGADTVRMYLGFIGPYQEAGSYPWSFGGIVGVRRFLEKVWRLQECVSDDTKEGKELTTLLHKTIKKVGEDIDSFKFNTAIAELMILVNSLEKETSISSAMYDTLLRLLAPFAPHIVEELWELRGNRESIHLQSWPAFDENLINEELKTVAIQVSGKTRATISLPAGMPEAEAVSAAKTIPEVEKRLKERGISRVVFVPDRLINFVLAEGEGNGENA
jgi:leucyl-tRNA synthetase